MRSLALEEIHPDSASSLREDLKQNSLSVGLEVALSCPGRDAGDFRFGRRTLQLVMEQMKNDNKKRQGLESP